jgi:DNA-binding MarR family transcriptional regulator
MPPKTAAAEVAMNEDNLDVSALTGLLGFHVRLAQTAMYRDYAATLKELDLTQKLGAVLMLLKSNPGVSQIALANTLGVDRATMMALIDRLEERDFVVRRRSASDRRRQELSLTAKGRTVLEAANQAIAAHERGFTARFSAAELAALIDALARIHEQI